MSDQEQAGCTSGGDQTTEQKIKRLAAAVAGIRHALARPDGHARLGVARRRRAHPLLDLTRHGQEGLLDVARVLGRRL
jgi:hypothetical protein